MKGNKHPKNDVTLNPSGNPSIRDLISQIDLDRRHFLSTAVHASALAAVSGLSTASLLLPGTVEAAPIAPSNGFGGMGFESIAAKLAPVANTVDVPAGYTVEVLAAWGQPIMPGAPDWNPAPAMQGASSAR